MSLRPLNRTSTLRALAYGIPFIGTILAIKDEDDYECEKQIRSRHE